MITCDDLTADRRRQTAGNKVRGNKIGGRRSVVGGQLLNRFQIHPPFPGVNVQIVPGQFGTFDFEELIEDDRA